MTADSKPQKEREPRYVLCEIASKPGLWACWDMEKHAYIYSDRRLEVMEKYVNAYNESWELLRRD